MLHAGFNLSRTRLDVRVLAEDGKTVAVMPVSADRDCPASSGR